MPWLKLNKYVDITGGSKVLAQDRTEQCKPPNVMPTAETSEFFTRDCQA